MDQLRNDFMPATFGKTKTTFNKSFDRLLNRIDYESEKESILPESAENTKDAFREFLSDLSTVDPLWNLPLWSFEALLEEKSGEFEFRADGKVPNWYHEFRNFLYVGAATREGLIPKSDYSLFGGLPVTTAIIMRHDSWEDLGQTPTMIYANLERKTHAYMDFFDPDQQREEISAIGFSLRQQSMRTVEDVDRLTRKHPILDENGAYVRKDNGKLVKIPRFGGNLHEYYDGGRESPHFSLVKFNDSIEGMSTRMGAFSSDADILYTRERRQFFGLRQLDKEAIDKFPFLKRAIHASDSMLGVLLADMETVNFYSDNKDKPEQNAEYARPVSIGRYIPAAKHGFNIIPRAFHPVSILVERMEDRAVLENNRSIALLLKNAIYPSHVGHFPMPHNFQQSLKHHNMSLNPPELYAPTMR